MDIGNISAGCIRAGRLAWFIDILPIRANLHVLVCYPDARILETLLFGLLSSGVNLAGSIGGGFYVEHGLCQDLIVLAGAALRDLHQIGFDLLAQAFACQLLSAAADDIGYDDCQDGDNGNTQDGQPKQ